MTRRSTLDDTFALMDKAVADAARLINSHDPTWGLVSVLAVARANGNTVPDLLEYAALNGAPVYVVLRRQEANATCYREGFIRRGVRGGLGLVEAESLRALKTEPTTIAEVSIAADSSEQAWSRKRIVARDELRMSLEDLFHHGLAEPDAELLAAIARETETPATKDHTGVHDPALETPRMPRHEEDLKRCIGALATLLADNAPRNLGFASKRKELPYNATKIADAVRRATGLNSATVAKWLGEAKDLPPKADE